MQGTPGGPDYKVCSIISFNTSVITVVFEKDTLYTLTNVLNYHPNENNLFIRILTEDNQIIE